MVTVKDLGGVVASEEIGKSMIVLIDNIRENWDSLVIVLKEELWAGVDGRGEVVGVDEFYGEVVEGEGDARSGILEGGREGRVEDLALFVERSDFVWIVGVVGGMEGDAAGGVSGVTIEDEAVLVLEVNEDVRDAVVVLVKGGDFNGTFPGADDLSGKAFVDEDDGGADKEAGVADFEVDFSDV